MLYPSKKPLPKAVNQQELENAQFATNVPFAFQNSSVVTSKINLSSNFFSSKVFAGKARNLADARLQIAPKRESILETVSDEEQKDSTANEIINDISIISQQPSTPAANRRPSMIDHQQLMSSGSSLVKTQGRTIMPTRTRSPRPALPTANASSLTADPR